MGVRPYESNIVYRRGRCPHRPVLHIMNKNFFKNKLVCNTSFPKWIVKLGVICYNIMHKMKDTTNQRL